MRSYEIILILDRISRPESPEEVEAGAAGDTAAEHSCIHAERHSHSKIGTIVSAQHRDACLGLLCDLDFILWDSQETSIDDIE